MSETQTGASVSIFEPPSSQVSRRYYKALVSNATGEPAGGAEVVIELTGDGSFAPNFRSQEIRRVTNEAGESEVFTWYRSGIYLRNCRATITASSGDLEVKLEETDEPKPELKISYVPTEIRIKPPRV